MWNNGQYPNQFGQQNVNQFAQPNQFQQPAGFAQPNQFAPQAGIVTSNQPMNMTQSGYSIDQLRNDLANHIAQLSQRDAASYQLAIEAQGPSGNWQSEALNKMSLTLSMTIDLMVRQNPGFSAQQLYNDALNEVYELSWASLISRNPQLHGDPTIAPKIPQVNNLIGLLNQRTQQFDQMQMLQNRGIQQVPQNQPWQPMQQQRTAPMFQQGPQQFNQPMQRPMSPQPRFGGLPASAMNNTFNNANINRTPEPMKAGGQFAPPVTNTNDVTDDIKRQIAEGKIWFDENGMPRSGDGTNKVQHRSVSNRAAQKRDASNMQPTQPQLRPQTPVQQPVQPEQPKVQSEFAGINTIPKKPSLFPDMPRANNLTDDQLEQQRQELREALLKAGGETRDGITEIDITSPEIMAVAKRAHEPVEQKPTLKQDEERYITSITERDKLAKSGHRFEEPNPWPLAVHPMNKRYFAILTKAGLIRQEVYDLGDENVKRDLHLDLLDPVRQNPLYQNDVAAHKSLVSTTLGGVLFNRFESAKVVLAEGMQKVGEKQREIEKRIEEADASEHDTIREEGAKELDTLIKAQYANYEEHVKQAVFECNEPDNKDGSMTEHEVGAKRLANQLRMVEENHEGTTLVDSIDQIPSEELITALEERSPENNDIIHTRLYRIETVEKILNTKEEADYIKDVLKDFQWKEAQYDDNGELIPLNPSDFKTSEKLADYMLKFQEEIPTEIFNRLNDRATRMFNQIAPVAHGRPSLSMDSFVYDYPEYVEWVKGLTDEEDPNNTNAFAFVEQAMLTVLMSYHDCIDKLMEEPDSEGNVDYIRDRAITSVRHVLNSHVPGSAHSFGITGNVNVLTKASHPYLFKIAESNLANRFMSLYSRTDTPMMIHDATMTFNDGSVYRIAPANGLVAVTDEDDVNISKGIALIRVDNV